MPESTNIPDLNTMLNYDPQALYNYLLEMATRTEKLEREVSDLKNRVTELEND